MLKIICLISLLILLATLLMFSPFVFAETMDHDRDEDQENILEDMIRGDDDVSSFLNDSGERLDIEDDGSGSRTVITTGSGEVY